MSCKESQNKKLLEEKKIGEKLHDAGLGSDFLDMAPKAPATREERDKLNLILLKHCCA